MARALIVGCGCRGRELGRALLADGWAVRGTTRSADRSAPIVAAGIEVAVADPDRLITLLDLVGDVAVICWLLGSATGTAGELAALHAERLERLLEEVVDTPVRGFVYEAAGSVSRRHIDAGRRALEDARDRWHIPYATIEADPGEAEAWTVAARGAVERVLN